MTETASAAEIPAPSFPPLMSGEATDGDPFALAIQRAREGTDAGLITHRIRPDHLSAALVLAPEAPLAEAISVVLAVSNGFADAFGSLAPSEVAAQFDWPGGFRINGARCGGLRCASSGGDLAAEPDWLVVALDVPFFAPATTEPGADPDRTTLWEEGCAEIAPLDLLEAWSRHTLIWINDWLDGDMARLHEMWRGRAISLGTEVELSFACETYRGTFLGLDEWGGLLLRTGAETRLLPLTLILEPAP